MAVSAGDFDVVKVFVEWGADVGALNYDGMGCLEMAFKCNLDLYDYLKKYVHCIDGTDLPYTNVTAEKKRKRRLAYKQDYRPNLESATEVEM